MTKICKICIKEKALNEFSKYSRICKPCKNQARRPLRHNQMLKERYGIDAQIYSSILAKQKGVCAICERPETRKHQNGKIKRLSVDHRHSDGKVRGLLCYACNTSVGFLREDFTVATKLAFYIGDHEGIK
jgi:hypothetical protein